MKSIRIDAKCECVNNCYCEPSELLITKAEKYPFPYVRIEYKKSVFEVNSTELKRAMELFEND